MEITKKAFVSCELVEGKTKVEAMGPLEEVFSLTAQLLAGVSLSIARAGNMGITDPERVIKAVCAAATDVLDDMGGK